jgi:hypothetical protein
MFEFAIKWAKERFPTEYRHMMRLWRASWRISPGITVILFIVISVPASLVSFTVGKMAGTTNIVNNIPGPTNGADQGEKTKVAIGPRRRETVIDAAPIPTSLRILFGPNGVQPKEIRSQNIEWQAIEQAYEGYAQKYSPVAPIPFDAQAWACLQNSSKVDERCWEKYSYKTLKLVLSFAKPITFKKISVETIQGGMVPTWEQVIMTETDAVLEFSRYPEDKLLDIKAIDEEANGKK